MAKKYLVQNSSQTTIEHKRSRESLHNTVALLNENATTGGYTYKLDFPIWRILINHDICPLQSKTLMPF